MTMTIVQKIQKRRPQFVGMKRGVDQPQRDVAADILRQRRRDAAKVTQTRKGK